MPQVPEMLAAEAERGYLYADVLCEIRNGGGEMKIPSEYELSCGAQALEEKDEARKRTVERAQRVSCLFSSHVSESFSMGEFQDSERGKSVLEEHKSMTLKEALSCTLDQAEWFYHQGVIGEKVWRRYMFFWTWAAARYSGEAARKQDRAYDRLGSFAFYRRRERVCRWLNQVVRTSDGK